VSGHLLADALFVVEAVAVDADDAKVGGPLRELTHPGGQHRHGGHHQGGAPDPPLRLHERQECDRLQRLS
jgi:hypothetical protein